MKLQVVSMMSGACLTIVAAACSGTKPQSAAAAVTAGASSTAAVNIYAGTGANAFSPEALKAKPLVYVPNSRGASVTEIDPKTYSVIRTFATGKIPQHVVPSYDLKTLWVANNSGSSLTPIDPTTGIEGRQIPVDDPYNLYFTPNGKYAMVIAERAKRVDFRDLQTVRFIRSVRVGCKGLDHVDFTIDGRYAIASCEFSGQLVKIDLATFSPVGYLSLLPDRRKVIKREAAHGIHNDVHAGTDDTSELMAIDAQHRWIRSDKIAASTSAQTPVTGVSGDPTKATPALGLLFIGYKIEAGVAQIRELTRSH